MKNKQFDASGNYAPALTKQYKDTGGQTFTESYLQKTGQTNRSVPADQRIPIGPMNAMVTWNPSTNKWEPQQPVAPDPFAQMLAALDFGAPSSLPPGYDATQGQKTFKYTGPTNLPGTQPAPQFDPAASFNNQAPPPPLPGLNTGGVNQFLTDPLMASYQRQNNPLYANQQKLDDFYGDPELFNVPTAMGAI